MRRCRTVAVVVLDSVGVGALPDAHLQNAAEGRALIFVVVFGGAVEGSVDQMGAVVICVCRIACPQINHVTHTHITSPHARTSIAPNSALCSASYARSSLIPFDKMAIPLPRLSSAGMRSSRRLKRGSDAAADGVPSSSLLSLQAARGDKGGLGRVEWRNGPGDVVVVGGRGRLHLSCVYVSVSRHVCFPPLWTDTDTHITELEVRRTSRRRAGR